jgi:hypothetical protein
MLGWLIRGYLLDRLLRAITGQGRPGPYGGGRPGYRSAYPSQYPSRRQLPRGYGPPPRAYGGRRPAPRRGHGGFVGPFPYYSTRTRGGSRVSVGGCCLPIPLGFLVGSFGLLAQLLRRRR